MKLLKPKCIVQIKSILTRLVIFSSFCFLISIALTGQDARDSGFKYFKNYSYKEYDHQPQNWGMVQAPDGIIYVANQGGVLEYDGVTWRVIDVPNYNVLSIAIDKQGTIYIGGKNEIGFLAPDSKGKLLYTSLRPFLPGKQIEFGEVWKTYASEKGIYFHTSKRLFRWDSQKKIMKVWEPQKKFYYSFSCSERYFVPQEGIGLMEMIDDKLQPVPDGDIFITRIIFMIEPYQDRDVLIGTDTEGFYLYNETQIKPFPTQVDNYLKNNSLYHGIRLSSGDYALATRRGGLVIMDPQGRLKYTWNKDSGLQDNFVYYVFEDREENLWLCLNKGISHIENTSPLSIYDDRSGLAGILLTVKRHHNELYVGSTNGLFYLESANKFSPVNGITTQCWDLASIGDSLLAATSGGVFLVDNKKNNCRRIIKDASFVLLPSQSQPGRIWCGTSNQLVILYAKDGQWLEERRYESINQEIRNIVEERNGDLWLVTKTGNVLKMVFDENPIHPTTTFYESSHGLPGGGVYAAHAAGHVMFATEKGLYRFDEKKNTFIPDNTINNQFAGGPSSPRIFRIGEDMVKNIWIHSESRNYQAIPSPGNGFTIYNTPFLRIPIIQVNAIYPEPGKKITWFASYDGLIKYDAAIKKNYSLSYRTLLRKITVNEEIIFEGIGINKSSQAQAAFFPYKKRNFHFEFTAPFFEVENENQYHCFLEGYDNGWSTWNKDTKKDYTNLEPGNYVFHVQAKNIYEHMGEEASYHFKILLPWYKKWWAFL
ncbi:MAG: hypothetical protein MUF15_18805, partial [Acidobacteria bacterium]|nr:hypothetical protein [Acidobacteriota bacterium]